MAGVYAWERCLDRTSAYCSLARFRSRGGYKSVRCRSGAEKGIERPLAALYINWLLSTAIPRDVAGWDLSLRAAGL